MRNESEVKGKIEEIENIVLGLRADGESKMKIREYEYAVIWLKWVLANNVVDASVSSLEWGLV
jgi:hypothetical protein